jgi:hypothetical protein
VCNVSNWTCERIASADAWPLDTAPRLDGLGPEVGIESDVMPHGDLAPWPDIQPHVDFVILPPDSAQADTTPVLDLPSTPDVAPTPDIAPPLDTSPPPDIALLPDIAKDKAVPDLQVPDLPVPDAPVPDGFISACASMYGSAQDYILCDAGPGWCSFSVILNGSTCNVLCQSYGAACLYAYDANNTPPGVECTPIGTDDCDTARYQEICVCSL